MKRTIQEINDDLRTWHVYGEDRYGNIEFLTQKCVKLWENSASHIYRTYLEGAFESLDITDDSWGDVEILYRWNDIFGSIHQKTKWIYMWLLKKRLQNRINQISGNKCWKVKIKLLYSAQQDEIVLGLSIYFHHRGKI